MNSLKFMTLYGDNTLLLEELYAEYSKNPASVSDDWKKFFSEIESHTPFVNGKSSAISTSMVDEKAASLPEMGIINLLNAYRRQGHLAANLDPLGIIKPNRQFIDQKLNNLSSSDLDTIVDSGIPNIGRAKLKEVIAWFEKTYCSTIGSEHYYLVNDKEREWLQSKMESTANSEKLSKGQCLRLFEKVFQAEYFEEFLAKKFVGKKRFSLEGGETLIPMLDTIIEEAGAHDMEGLVIGMAHRGRLNVLVNIIEKPAGLIFAEFEEKTGDEEHYADVKYHLGYSNARMTKAEKEIKLSLGFNPSHLEAVNPVITGNVRAKQTLSNDNDRTKYMPILIHGDAAFAGQGVVAETLNLMNIEGYTTGGTFHIVINNQIGFTTLPNESRSTLYATDLAKGFQIPIFHINGDDPEAAHRVVKICLEYRQKFHKDVIIDLFCYRRLGHNETDEPAFTQPQMYDIIKTHKSTAKIYEALLLSRKEEFHQEDIDFIKNGAKKGLEDSFLRAKEQDIRMQVDTMKGVWANYSKEPLDSEPATKLLSDQMQGIVKALTELPEDFHPNPKLVKLIENRKKMALGEIPIDWGFAELLSFGSILENGFKIRLSGQDAQRGTFSHRHAVLVDSNNGRKYSPLQHISEKQGEFEVINSSLSEYAVLGFEYGYSLSDPDALVIWEAQFGDFANTAQVMFDQFISSSEVKWQRMSGLVMLLPHGYEGQGPEHSSARPERLLQLCALDNIQICNCTTPAQYFHLLRRQMLRNSRKPLIILSPKSLLRFPAASSILEDISKGAFREVLTDKTVADPKEITKLIFSNGKVYYDLLEEKIKRKKADTALIRIEQLYPFPENEIAEVMKLYKNAREFVWVQEEPRNQGAWGFIENRINKIVAPKGKFRYAGRQESPSPAAGQVKIHLRELAEFMDEAFR